MTNETGLNLPDLPEPGLNYTSGWFEIPEVTVRIHTKPELVGELLDLISEAVELGAHPDWFRGSFENAATQVLYSDSTRQYLPALVRLAILAAEHGLISVDDAEAVLEWAKRAAVVDESPPPRFPTADRREEWEAARNVLQGWIDALESRDRKKLLRQRSVARVTCEDCNSMLAWLVPQAGFDFLVILRCDEREFEVAYAVGEYGGYTRGRCGRKGGRTWVLHADYLRAWLGEGIADMSVRHVVEKGM